MAANSQNSGDKCSDKTSESAAAEAETCPPVFRAAASSVEFNKLRKRLLRQMRQAMADFSMPETAPNAAAELAPNQPPPKRPKWLVALSGGKDSYGLLALLPDLQWRGMLPAELPACNLNQGQPGFPKHILPDYLSRNGIAHRIEYQDTIFYCHR